MFHDDIIKQILDAWISDQTHPGRDRIAVPIPDANQIRKIVEIAFIASLKREEDRPLKFALVLANSVSKTELSADPDTIKELHLTQPIPFTVDAVCKMAPALDPERTAIAVGPNTDDGALHIWGLFMFKRRSHRFNELPVAYGMPPFQPDNFTVYAKNPGSLLIARALSLIGRFVNGEFTPAIPTPFSSHSLGKFLLHAIQDHKLYKEYGNPYWHVYRDTIQILLAETGSRGHGSTIVLLGGTEPSNCCKYNEVRYAFLESIGFQKLFHELFERESPHGLEALLLNIALRNVISERIEIVSQLAAIDGAVLLNTELNLVGYAATLRAPVWTGKVMVGPDAYGQTAGKTFERTHLGTRHNSAIDFAGSCPDGIVFVISQDGPVRAFVRGSDDTVFCWPDCTTSMFV